jgi:hypothetical protein
MMERRREMEDEINLIAKGEREADYSDRILE